MTTTLTGALLDHCFHPSARCQSAGRSVGGRCQQGRTIQVSVLQQPESSGEIITVPVKGRTFSEEGGFNRRRKSYQSISEVNQLLSRLLSVTADCRKWQKLFKPSILSQLSCFFNLLALRRTDMVGESFLYWIVCFIQAIILFGWLYTPNRSCQESALHYPPVCCEAAAAAASEGASLQQV